jgi:hypothetical protein
VSGCLTEVCSMLGCCEDMARYKQQAAGITAAAAGYSSSSNQVPAACIAALPA